MIKTKHSHTIAPHVQMMKGGNWLCNVQDAMGQKHLDHLSVSFVTMLSGQYPEHTVYIVYDITRTNHSSPPAFIALAVCVSPFVLFLFV